MHSKMELVLPSQEMMPSNDWHDLINFLSSEHQYYPLYRLDQKKLYSGEPEHVIATLNNVNTLLAELKASELDEYEDSIYDESAPAYSEKYSLRYLVTPNMQMLFAKEGQLSKIVPGHKYMADTCLAAGNIFFSKDYSRVILITHDSGDFQPNANSLLWPAIILALCPAAACLAFDCENIVIKLSEYKEEKFKTTLVHCVQETLSKALIREFIPLSDELKQQIITVNASAEKLPPPAKTAASTKKSDFVYCTPPSSPKKQRVLSGISELLKDFITLTRVAMVPAMPAQAAADLPMPSQANALQSLGLFATDTPNKKRKTGTALYLGFSLSDDEEGVDSDESLLSGSDDSASSNCASPLWESTQPRFLSSAQALAIPSAEHPISFKY